MIFREVYSLSLLLIRNNCIDGIKLAQTLMDPSTLQILVCEDTTHISGVLMRETNRIVRDTVVDEIAN